MSRSAPVSNPFEGIFDVDRKREAIQKIAEDLTLEHIWSSPEKTKELFKERSRLENIIEPLDALEEKMRYIEESIGILDEAGGELFLKEIKKEIDELRKETEALELRNLLSGEMDRNNAIMTIHPGAGGTESQDWAQMLMRMYVRWAERNGFDAKIVDLLPGEEAGIKSVTITFSGEYAYGYLKSEAGIHRLVRISPFDANKRRHTSFASVIICPELEDEEVVEINEEEIKMDTFRASGAGGQHVNKTSSAVRLTHLPTGIVVSCQNERSQHKNRATAMKILRARLYEIQLQEKEKKMDQIVGDKKDIAWGHQIRSYVLQPYRMVKDHRTGFEVGNVDAILDGEIEAFLTEFLKKKTAS